MSKQRVDALLVGRGLVESAEKARALVMAGKVSAGGRSVFNPGTLVAASAELRVVASRRYVSRGGEKLEHALRTFGLDVTGLVAADIGSSTGGFTDCLLQHGALRVYAVDAGKGQLEYGLRKDPRVVVMEGVNARYLSTSGGLAEPVDIVTADLSFISLRLVLPAARQLLAAAADSAASQGAAIGAPAPGARGSAAAHGWGCEPRAETRARGSIVALFKPQFEAAKGETPRGGVIRDSHHHAVLIGRFAAWCVANGFRVLDLAASPVLGSSGNREFLFWLTPGEAAA